MSVWHIIVLIFAIIIYVLPGVIASSREHKKRYGNMGVKYCPGLELLGLDSRACLVFHKPRSG